MSVGPVTSASSPTASAPTGGAGHSFLAVLNALNPLQYLPVVGTIYRAVTGDTIPEGLRIVGTLAVGAAISGPVGLVTGIAAIMAEKATGIDPDKILHRVAVGLGLTRDPPTVQVAAAPTPAEPAASTAQTPLPVASIADLSDTERLNAQELARIRLASAAYAKAASLA
ncbi:MAG: hypothetical protein WBV77_11025 [Solirubrobacteraceae bacterium]